MTPPDRRQPSRGPRLGQALLVLSLGALTYSARLPSLRREALERRVAEAEADVQTLRAAAQRFRLQRGRWPEGAAAGASPPELTFELPRAFDPRGDGYSLQWTRLERLVHATPDAAAGPEPGSARPTVVPSRPVTDITEIGAITVVSGNPSLLALLHRDHGATASFVTDSTWTVLLVEPLGR